MNTNSRISFSSSNRTVFSWLLLINHSLFVDAQLLPTNINLGSFSLQRIPSTGDLQLGIGQGANIFGFGGDRQIGLNVGPGRFGTNVDNGLLVGGRRFGIDSHLGYQRGAGIDLGSILNLFQPIGPEQFLQNSPFSAPRPFASQRHNPIFGHGVVPSAPRRTPTETNSEEIFPPSVGNGWEDEGTDKEGWTERPEEENVEMFVEDEQRRSIVKTEKGKETDKMNSKRKKTLLLPMLDGLEPLKLV